MPSYDRGMTPEATLYRDAIRAVLEAQLPKQGLVLEVASGNGGHSAELARSFPFVAWQPTEIDPAALTALESLHATLQLPNFLRPIAMDVTSAPWPIAKADAVVAIDFTHVVPWESVVALFERSAHVLSGGSCLHLFGPVKFNGKYHARETADLDWELQQRDARLGVRDISALMPLASRNGFGLPKPQALQPSGHSLSFTRSSMPPPTGKFQV
jgi:hypothetical protein